MDADALEYGSVDARFRAVCDNHRPQLVGVECVTSRPYIAWSYKKYVLSVRNGSVAVGGVPSR